MRVTTYLRFPPLAWVCRLWYNNSHLGKEEVLCGPARAAEHSGGANAVVNQALTGVWSGRMIGIRPVSLALLVVITSEHQPFGALVSLSSLTLDTWQGEEYWLS